jgi:hypothetical protein
MPAAADARPVRLQYDLLEEPARVRERPFRGTDIGHALHEVVFDLQRLADGETRLVRAPKRAREMFSGPIDRWCVRHRAHNLPDRPGLFCVTAG